MSIMADEQLQYLVVKYLKKRDIDISQDASIARPWLEQDFTVPESLIPIDLGIASRLSIKKLMDSYIEI